MKIDVYKLATHEDKYLSVPAGTDIAKMTFPSALHSYLHKLPSIDKTLDIQPGDTRAGFDSADIIYQIEQNGFSTHEAKVTVTKHTSPRT